MLGESERVQVRTQERVRLSEWIVVTLSSNRESMPGQLALLEEAGRAALSN